MNSVVKLIGGSNVQEAERVVEFENLQIVAEARKRRLLSFGPIGDGLVVFTPPPLNTLGNVVAVNSFREIASQSTSTSLASVAIPPGLGCLEQTSHLFIRHAGINFVQKFFDLANKYEILNSDGICILYAGETQERFGLGRDRNQGKVFDVSILGTDGVPLLNIYFRKGVTTVSDFHRVIGSCIDITSPFGLQERYSIRDWNLCEILTFRRSVNGPGWEFDIVNKELIRVGQFTNNWSSTLPNYVALDKLYGISFPLDMAVEEKAILFGGLFTVYFQNLHLGGKRNSGKPWVFCISMIIGLLLVIGIIAIVLWAILKD